MIIMNKFSKHTWMIIGFLFLQFFLTQTCFAVPGIKITEPQNGTVIYPGQECTIRVEAIEGFKIKRGVLGMFNIQGLHDFNSLPLVITGKVPIDVIGTVTISVGAEDATGNTSEDEIILEVQQLSNLQYLVVEPDKFLVNIDWDGNIKVNEYMRTISVNGIYSDGVRRDLNKDRNTSFVSSEPLVASVNSKGEVHVHKVGEAKITVSNSGITKEIPLVFKKPSGIKPSETIPPTTQIDIVPKPNSAGWNNSDIKISLVAKDNEDGSGIREVDYSITGTDEQGLYVKNDRADINFSKEGSYEIVYAAIDKEGNFSDTQRYKLNLDKTSPTVSISAGPNILWPPDNKMVAVTINGQATDNLSGIESLTIKVVDEYGKVQPSIAGFGSIIKLEASRKGDDINGRIYTITVTAKDKAGNESSASTIVRVPHDMEK